VADMKVTKDVYISPKDMEDLSQYWDFFECEEEVAPERLDDEGLLNQLTFHITTNFVAAVKRIGRIRVDLNSNQDAQRKKRKRSSTNDKLEAIRIKLELTLGSAIGVLEVRALHGRPGVEVGKAKIEYSREKGRMTRGGC
jgi:hypothetical protein